MVSGDNWTTGAISRAKLQSNHHHQQTNIQFFLTGRMPFLSPNQQCQSTEGKKITHSMDLLTPSSNGVFQLCLLPQIAPGYLGEGCHASHQPYDASTPFSFTYHHAKCRIHTSNGMNIKHAHRICDNADRRTERSFCFLQIRPC